ncbi:DUF4932 domain-containing protein [Mucilaginibacter gossypii]|uniref:DUF4932 domain-containing protein n=1 Tax=Mucilaginibacter gossypii TaxID=551996 RepID=UPI000DCEC4EF|nr:MULTISPECIES: DUF4932 domain-containing protein [Mucilaginibacter]QTE40178.1 DUF4932 domain-containing protein [Mucilaginibacter gossypii]RAV50115.1 DUF4932 domain-containing protein [Mucilaginibacter rubeus]
MRLLFTLITLLTFNAAFGQAVTETYPKTLFCPDDSIRLSFSKFPGKEAYCVSGLKTSPGTDATTGIYATFYYGKDSVKINYHNNLPYGHVVYIKLESPKGSSTLRLHFNEISNSFPKAYMAKNLNNIQFDIPEPYELANIIWTLSPTGQKATDLNKEGDYYKKVVTWFKPYMDHKLFKALSFPDSLYGSKYYEFRENSFAFNFQDTVHGSKNTKLLFNGPYYYVYGDELADSSLFGKLKPLVEDFAAKSNFRKFYQQNLPYYRQQLARQKTLLPVRQMWTWLENQFPKRKYQSYRIVSSPLIGGSHSTQRYATYDYDENKLFTENAMFICGTDRYDREKELSEKQREGLMTGIVFTEIDHNYINPTTSVFAKQIDSIFSKRSVWAKTGNSSDFYGNPVSVFNEYMTHAAFCLYIADNYDKQVADYVIERREALMVERRNFIHFKEFDQELLRLHRQNRNLKTADLYPMIVSWCKTQI